MHLCEAFLQTETSASWLIKSSEGYGNVNWGEDPTPQTRQLLAAVSDDESEVRTECR